MKNAKTIIISRVDSIGDVVLTLPVAGALKKAIPNCKIIFLGNDYTKSIIESCTYVDEFLNVKDVLDNRNGLSVLEHKNATDIIHVFPNKKIAFLAKKAKIKNRIATKNRLYHWLTCNNLVELSRKNSNLHEAQLNLKLLEPFNVKSNYTIDEIKDLYGLKVVSINYPIREIIEKDKRLKIILHPKSKGSAREWGSQNFEDLIRLLDDKKYQIFISGTIQEKYFADALCLKFPHLINLCGTMSLEQFIAFINDADMLVSCSTGPLHIAAALGKKSIGLFAPMKPIFPQRWAPIGKNAKYLVINKDCNSCRKGGECACIMQIEAQKVYNLINENT